MAYSDVMSALWYFSRLEKLHTVLYSMDTGFNRGARSYSFPLSLCMLYRYFARPTHAWSVARTLSAEPVRMGLLSATARRHSRAKIKHAVA